MINELRYLLQKEKDICDRISSLIDDLHPPGKVEYNVVEKHLWAQIDLIEHDFMPFMHGYVDVRTLWVRELS